MMTFLFEHEDVDYEDLDKDINQRRNYWRLDEARKSIAETEKELKRPDRLRPVAYFLYPGLTVKTLHDFLQCKRSTNANITHALRLLQNLDPKYAEKYLSRNGRPCPFQTKFPAQANVSNNAVTSDNGLCNSKYYTLYYGSQELLSEKL